MNIQIVVSHVKQTIILIIMETAYHADGKSFTVQIVMSLIIGASNYFKNIKFKHFYKYIIIKAATVINLELII